MVGLVLSDNFLLTASWERDGGAKTTTGVLKVPFTEPITSLLHDESELNAILASALRQAKEANPFAGQEIVVGLPDSFVEHSIMPIEQDLSKDDHMTYMEWIESKKNRSKEQSVYLFGQVYFPAESNIHVCGVPRHLKLLNHPIYSQYF